MIAILGGLVAACAWAATSLISARSSRLVGGPRTLAWIMLVGFVLVAPYLALGRPRLSPELVAGVLVSGGGNVAGLLCQYAGMRRGRVGVVAPLASVYGGIAALLSAAAGEAIAPAEGLALLVIAAGVVCAAAAPDDPAVSVPIPAPRAAAALGLASAVMFGASLYATGRIATELPLAWAVMPARLVGTVCIAAPLLARRAIAVPRRVWPLVATAGVLEIVGFLGYAMGSQAGIATASVIASEFAAIATVAAWLVFGERLGRVQRIGVATIAVGVALLAIGQA